MIRNSDKHGSHFEVLYLWFYRRSLPEILSAAQLWEAVQSGDAVTGAGRAWFVRLTLAPTPHPQLSWPSFSSLVMLDLAADAKTHIVGIQTTTEALKWLVRTCLTRFAVCLVGFLTSWPCLISFDQLVVVLQFVVSKDVGFFLINEFLGIQLG